MRAGVPSNTGWRAAAGKTLAKGPRGGGRELDEIGWHVLEAQAAYLGKLGWPLKVDPRAPLAAELRRARDEAQAGLEAAMRGELPARGPRGGLRWTPALFRPTSGLASSRSRLGNRGPLRLTAVINPTHTEITMTRRLTSLALLAALAASCGAHSPASSEAVPCDAHLRP